MRSGRSGQLKARLMREQRDVKYILRFNRYYIFWEDHSETYADKAAAESAKNNLKAEKPPYWKWKIVEQETIVRETDFFD
jgi:hypothetical protein